jgi:TonB system transport protein ExbD (group 1)
MGAKLGGGGGSKFTAEANSDINVTPFVDIMLVLLIIFMVAAPMATVSVKVDLPPSNAAPTPNPAEPIFVSLQKDGKLYLGDDIVTLATLPALIEAKSGGDKEERIFVRADQELMYGRLMELINTLQDAGYYRVGLVAEDAKPT